jgi:hypothetical protein
MHIRHHLGGKGDYETETFGTADDFSDADGVAVLNFWQAQVKARERMVERAHRSAGKKAFLTVASSIDSYVEFLEANRKSGEGSPIRGGCLHSSVPRQDQARRTYRRPAPQVACRISKSTSAGTQCQGDCPAIQRRRARSRPASPAQVDR